MSIVANPDNPREMKIVKVAVQVETDSIVHRCDRCRKEAPCAILRQVDTDRHWKNGEIRLADLPEGWVNFRPGGVPDHLGNMPAWAVVELCPDCLPPVQAAWEVFIAAAGLRLRREGG